MSRNSLDRLDGGGVDWSHLGDMLREKQSKGGIKTTVPTKESSRMTSKRRNKDTTVIIIIMGGCNSKEKSNNTIRGEGMKFMRRGENEDRHLRLIYNIMLNLTTFLLSPHRRTPQKRSSPPFQIFSCLQLSPVSCRSSYHLFVETAPFLLGAAKRIKLYCD